MCSGRRERRRLGGVHGTRYLFLLESAPSRGRDGGEGVGVIVTFPNVGRCVNKRMHLVNLPKSHVKPYLICAESFLLLNGTPNRRVTNPIRHIIRQLGVPTRQEACAALEMSSGMFPNA